MKKACRHFKQNFSFPMFNARNFSKNINEYWWEQQNHNCAYLWHKTSTQIQNDDISPNNYITNVDTLIYICVCLCLYSWIRKLWSFWCVWCLGAWHVYQCVHMRGYTLWFHTHIVLIGAQLYGCFVFVSLFTLTSPHSHECQN